jgi:hypothetical protein
MKLPFNMIQLSNTGIKTIYPVKVRGFKVRGNYIFYVVSIADGKVIFKTDSLPALVEYFE